MRETIPIPRGLAARIWRARPRAAQARSHRHSVLEMNLVVRGHARYLLEGRAYELRPNHMVWLFPAQEHVLVEPSEDFEMWIAVFRRGLVVEMCMPGGDGEALRRWNPRGRFVRALTRDAARFLDRLCAELARFAPEPPAHKAGVACLLRCAWNMWSREARALPSDALHPAIQRAARLLVRPDAPALPELAVRCGLSAGRLSRLFHRELGVTVTDFRNRARIEAFLENRESGKGQTMLADALEAGFGSYEQFLRAFKREKGVAPGRYIMP